MFPSFGERLARAGFTAIALNVSGSGVDDRGDFAWPERFARNTFSAEQRDLDSLIAALDAGRLGVPRPTTVGIVGHSRGGGMAVLLAAREPRIRALVTWAAISHVNRWTPAQVASWRESGRLEVVNSRTGQVLPIERDLLDDVERNAGSTLDVGAAAARITVPWLIVHGAADETVPAAEADALAAVARPDLVERLTPAGAGHTFGATHPFVGMTPALGEVFDATIRHLARAL
jgi:dienelactone hydrolase